jgi:hypothetical protein
MWTAAAAAALATAFAIPAALAQETQQGKQETQHEKQAPGGSAGSVQRRETGPGQMGGQATQPRPQAQTERPPTNAGEREQPGKPGMKGESAQTQQPENRIQPGNAPRRETGSQAQERREQLQGERGGQAQERKGQAERGGQAQERKGQAENGARPEQPGTAGEQNRTGGAQMGQAPNRQGPAGTRTGGNVQTTGKTNIPHDKAAQVAQTLRASGAAQTSPNINASEVSIGASLPGEVVINPLPLAIVALVPEFRGYDYFVFGDEVVIVDPATREVVEIIEDVG